MSLGAFHHSLVVARWARGFFDGNDDAVRRCIIHPELEGIDTSCGQTRFYRELSGSSLLTLTKCDEAVWREYDKRIVTYWQEITQKRNQKDNAELNLKYFQYLSLLVTEVYLDWYFNRREKLLKELNEEVTQYNEKQKKQERLSPIEADGLNKIAFWMATGSGKTLLMQINIKQFRYYAKKAGKMPARSRSLIGTGFICGFLK